MQGGNAGAKGRMLKGDRKESGDMVMSDRKQGGRIRRGRDNNSLIAINSVKLLDLQSNPAFIEEKTEYNLCCFCFVRLALMHQKSSRPAKSDNCLSIF